MQRLVAAVRRPRTGLLWITLLHVASLALFLHGFLLTRVQLTQRSTAGAPPAPAPYTKVVWLLVDALRYDMAVSDGRYSCQPSQPCHQRQMPFLANLTSHQPAAARAFRFVADPPTTTTQRLKALVTGGLPTFFDVSNSFSAGALREDNLLDQLHAAGKKLAFVGDATWQQLFPTQFHWTRPEPCFNIKDLHSVDDAVAAALPGLLAQPGDWDLLIGHYLGVDHAGHAHGVSSPEMLSKLRQLDAEVAKVARALVAGAAPGRPYEHALLVVAGDHGQTLGGDHGGGSPEEVDSALLAVDVSALRAAWAAASHSAAGEGAAASPWGLSGCREGCTCGDERNQCADDMLQLDFAATLAPLLGVPIPYANLGKVSAELWALAAGHPGGGAGREEWEQSLADALTENANQVHRYLSTYAATPGTAFSRAALTRLSTQHASLPPAGASAVERKRACYAFLGAAAEVAREQWTQFGGASIVAGLALFAATILLHAVAAFGGGRDSSAGAGSRTGGDGSWGTVAIAWAQRQHLLSWPAGQRVPTMTLPAILGGLVLVHALGIFSFFFLLTEGTAVCYLLGMACAALAVATAVASRRAGQGLRGPLVLGMASLRCNGLMALLGLAHHTGQGFWHRLTVHDPQPAGDVAVGWHSRLAFLQRFWTAAMQAAGLDQLPPSVQAVLQHAATCILPLLLLAGALDRLQVRRGRRAVAHRVLLACAFASVAGFHLLEVLQQQQILPEEASAIKLLGTTGVAHDSWEHLLRSVPPAAAQAAHALVAAPLRLLLPQLTYGLCGLAAALWGLRLLLPLAGTRTAEAGPLAMVHILAALVLQLSDVKAPAVLLLGLVEVAVLQRLLARRGELASGGRALGAEAAALLALVQMQLFFATGHLCEFAGLEYTAAFVGLDDFHLYRGGLLLAVQTYGGVMLAALALPAVCQRLPGFSSGGGEQEGGNTAAAQRLAAPLLVLGLARSLTAFTAALSAAIQRRHLYVWALFAPKLAFEVCFLLATDCALLLASL